MDTKEQALEKALGCVREALDDGRRGSMSNRRRVEVDEDALVRILDKYSQAVHCGQCAWWMGWDPCNKSAPESRKQCYNRLEGLLEIKDVSDV